MTGLIYKEVDTKDITHLTRPEFINGQEQTETQVAGTTRERTRSTQFGIGLNGWNTSAQTWKGRIYYLAVYNDSVTTAKALQNYNALKDRFV